MESSLDTDINQELLMTDSTNFQQQTYGTQHQRSSFLNNQIPPLDLTQKPFIRSRKKLSSNELPLSQARATTHSDLKLEVTASPILNYTKTSRTPMMMSVGSVQSNSSAVKKTMLTKSIIQKEEYLLKRLNDLQELGSNRDPKSPKPLSSNLSNKGGFTREQETNPPMYKSARALNFHANPLTNKTQDSDHVLGMPQKLIASTISHASQSASNFMYSTHQNLLKNCEIDIDDQSERISPIKPQQREYQSSPIQDKPSQFEDLKYREFKINHDDQRFIDRLKQQFLSNETSSPKNLQSNPLRPANTNHLKNRGPFWQQNNKIQNEQSVNSINLGMQSPQSNKFNSYQQKKSPQSPIVNNMFHDNPSQQVFSYQRPESQNTVQQVSQMPNDESGVDFLNDIEADRRMFEELEQELGPSKNTSRVIDIQESNKKFIANADDQTKKRGKKQQKQSSRNSLANDNTSIRSPRQGQPLPPQQRQLNENLFPNKIGINQAIRSKWQQPTNLLPSQLINNDQVLFNTTQDTLEKWQRINEILNKLKFEKIDIQQINDKYGPVEESVIATIFMLTREIQTLQKKKGDYEENQKLEKELNNQRELTLKQEQNIFVIINIYLFLQKLEQQLEQFKHQDRRDNLEQSSLTKKLEKQLKDCKTKLYVSENTIQKRQQDIEELKKKLEKRLAEDERYSIRDKQTFERHFGKQPRLGEEKYVQFLKMYENQREKNEKQIELLEREITRLNQNNQELENENYALSKGQLPPKEAQFFVKGDGQLSLKLREQEDRNHKLQEALQKYQGDFKDLLKEIEKLKIQMKDKDEQMFVMEQEMKARPNLSSVNATQMIMSNLNQQLQDLQIRNNELENELMMLRNQTGSHINKPNIKNNLNLKRTTTISPSDSKLLIEEIQEILELQGQDDPVIILETIRKLEKVVKAVPRMETFITNICKALSDDPSNKQLPVEQVIPKINYLRDILINQYQPLAQFKRDLTFLLFQQNNVNLQAMDLLKEVERIIIEKEHIKQMSQKENEQGRALTYMMELFEVGDPHQLVEKVNQTFVYVNEFNTFMKIARSLLQMDQSVTVSTCLNAVRNILIGYCQRV